MAAQQLVGCPPDTDAPDGRKKRVWHVLEAAHQAKNTEVRHVDFNPALAAFLTAMKTRRAPDSQWLVPSPQRGDRDIHAQTFRESLKLAREAIQMPNLGFHDTRHAFISRAVMTGIDFMTIARWVGHKVGGVLIGKVWRFLDSARVFGPASAGLVQSEKFVESQVGKLGDISIYGQESNATNRRLAIMNLAIRGIEAPCDQPEAQLTTTQTESHRFLEASLHHALPA